MSLPSSRADDASRFYDVVHPRGSTVDSYGSLVGGSSDSSPAQGELGAGSPSASEMAS